MARIIAAGSMPARKTRMGLAAPLKSGPAPADNPASRTMLVSAAEAPRAGPPRFGSTSTNAKGAMPKMTSHAISWRYVAVHLDPVQAQQPMEHSGIHTCQTPDPTQTPNPTMASRRISVVLPGRAPEALAAPAAPRR
ncbi:hypothetical protein NKJ59_23905 [Mesorhizobium australicum]|uniref:hypothetical protein n=1 Tax=Mesorhizobium australicum TaxID=536018 RepID=UPI003335D3A6